MITVFSLSEIIHTIKHENYNVRETMLHHEIVLLFATCNQLITGFIRTLMQP